MKNKILLIDDEKDIVDLIAEALQQDSFESIEKAYTGTDAIKEQLWDAEELLDELEFKKDFLKKPVSSYSKGMRQRVSMARALISNPKLLFLDEPTSGLDPTGAVLFRKIIEKERQKGTTVFLTTHNMLDADLLCDRVAFISNGNIVALDSPRNLREQNSNHSIIID